MRIRYQPNSPLAYIVETCRALCAGASIAMIVLFVVGVFG